MSSPNAFLETALNGMSPDEKYFMRLTFPSIVGILITLSLAFPYDRRDFVEVFQLQVGVFNLSSIACLISFLLFTAAFALRGGRLGIKLGCAAVNVGWFLFFLHGLAITL